MMPYERLAAWEKCHALTLAVYQATRQWPREEIYGLTPQARRAAYSATANMAEGAAKQGSREFRRFLDMSVGSLNELSYILRESAGKLTWRLYDAIRKKSPPRSYS